MCFEWSSLQDCEVMKRENLNGIGIEKFLNGVNINFHLFVGLFDPDLSLEGVCTVPNH